MNRSSRVRHWGRAASTGAHQNCMHAQYWQQGVAVALTTLYRHAMMSKRVAVKEHDHQSRQQRHGEARMDMRWSGSTCYTRAALKAEQPPDSEYLL